LSTVNNHNNKETNGYHTTLRDIQPSTSEKDMIDDGMRPIATKALIYDNSVYLDEFELDMHNSHSMFEEWMFVIPCKTMKITELAYYSSSFAPTPRCECLQLCLSKISFTRHRPFTLEKLACINLVNVHAFYINIHSNTRAILGDNSSNGDNNTNVSYQNILTANTKNWDNIQQLHVLCSRPYYAVIFYVHRMPKHIKLHHCDIALQEHHHELLYPDCTDIDPMLFPYYYVMME
jgi:hypothetical protein